jgi:hypothetical protein
MNGSGRKSIGGERQKETGCKSSNRERRCDRSIEKRGIENCSECEKSGNGDDVNSNNAK